MQIVYNFSISFEFQHFCRISNLYTHVFLKTLRVLVFSQVDVKVNHFNTRRDYIYKQTELAMWRSTTVTILLIIHPLGRIKYQFAI